MAITRDEVLREALALFDGNMSALGRHLEMTPTPVTRWFSGQSRPDPWTCLGIADLLKRPPEDVLEAFGHDPYRIRVLRHRPGADGPRSELDVRLEHLGKVLETYPRPFWLSVIEANERMVEGTKSLTSPPSAPAAPPAAERPLPPSNPRPVPPAKSPRHRLERDHDAPDETLRSLELAVA